MQINTVDALVHYELLSEDEIDFWTMHTLMKAKLNGDILGYKVHTVLLGIHGLRHVCFSITLPATSTEHASMTAVAQDILQRYLNDEVFSLFVGKTIPGPTTL